MTNATATSPLLSIITVCLNAPKLEQTCESIVNQVFQDFEWIVIDGGSNEGTLAIFEKYKYRIDYFVSEKDSGIYEAMNKGIRRSHGQWLNFMNGGDCFFADTSLQGIFHPPGTYDNFDVLYCDTYVAHCGKMNSSLYPSDTKLNKQYFYNFFLPHLAMFYRSGVFMAHGLYDETFTLLADTKKNIELFLSGARFKSINTLLTVFDDNRIGNVASMKKQKVEMDRIRALYFIENEDSALHSKSLLEYTGDRVVSRLRDKILHKRP